MSSSALIGFKRGDASSYDPLADSFDRLSDRFSAPLAAAMLQRARLGPSDRVLDVGTGTGLVAMAAARMLGPRAQVLGVDLSAGMLASARARCAHETLGDRVRFCRMDAEALALPAACLDVVVALFALLHFPDPAVALGEMRRVLRPGGRLVLGLGSPPPLLSAAGLRRGVSRARSALRASFGRELSAPRFLEALVEQRLPRASAAEETTLAREARHHAPDLGDLLRGAGLQAQSVGWEGGAAVIETVEEFWELQRTYSSRARKRLASVSPQAVESLREEFLARARRVKSRGGRLVYPYGALFVTARRPAEPHA